MLGVTPFGQSLYGRRPALTCGLRAIAILITLVVAGCGGDPPDTRTADGKADGRKVYQLYCAGCHGVDGRRGKGEMVIVDGEQEPAAEIRRVVEEGRDEMPAWKQRLAPDELDAVVEFLRQLEAEPVTPG